MHLKKGKGEIALAIAEKLREAGYTAYFAGGCVRDHLMRKEPDDYDIATTARPEGVEEIFRHTVPVGKQFGVMLVVEEGIVFEVATFRTEGEYEDGRHPSEVTFALPEQDAARRDFTVNGLFYDPFKRRVIDFVGGVGDIRRKRIRSIGDPRLRFEEDKLRLLRAIRFAANLQFKIDEETWRVIVEKAPLIGQVSAERIREEVTKIFTRPGAGRGFDLLSESGLMQQILPEIEAMKSVKQQPDFHPEGDVFVHTRLLMEKLKDVSLTVALGALFHDVGKPPTYKVREGMITFYGHASVGAAMTRQIMRRLRFSNDEIRDVAECVANHMKFADVQKMRAGKLKLFMSRPTFGEELEMHRIDCLSSHGKLDHYEFLKRKMKEFAQEELKPKAFVNGHDLIAMGMKPGPAIKKVLEEAYERQLEGKVKDREGALDFCRRKVAKFLESHPA